MSYTKMHTEKCLNIFNLDNIEPTSKCVFKPILSAFFFMGMAGRGAENNIQLNKNNKNTKILQVILPSRGYRFSSVNYLLPTVCIIYSTFRNQNSTCIIRYFYLVRQTTNPNRFIEEFIWFYSSSGITVGGQSRKLREYISNHKREAMKETGNG